MIEQATHHAFGLRKYGIGIDPQTIRLNSIDGIEQGDTCFSSIHLRNGRTISVAWATVDGILSTLDQTSQRQFVRFARDGSGESYAVLALDAIDSCTANSQGVLVDLAGGQQVQIVGMTTAALTPHLAENAADRAPKPPALPDLKELASHIHPEVPKAIEPEPRTAWEGIDHSKVVALDLVDELRTAVSGVAGESVEDGTKGQCQAVISAIGMLRANIHNARRLSGSSTVLQLIDDIRAQITNQGVFRRSLTYANAVLNRLTIVVEQVATQPAKRSLIPVIYPRQTTA